MKLNKVKINTLIVIIVMLLAKILAFFKEILVSNNFGIGIETDAYNIVYLVVITLFGVVGSALTNAIMPVLTQKYIECKQEFEKTANAIITIVLIITLLISIAMIIFPGIFINLFASSLDNNTFLLSKKLLKIGSISLVFLAINSIIGSILRVYDYVVIPTISNIIFPIPGVLSQIFFENNIKNLTYALVIGYVLQVLFQIIFLIIKKFKFKLIFNFKETGILKILLLMPPMILSSGVLQISSIFDNQVASSFGNGSISALALASKVNALFFTVFATASMQVIYSTLSKLYAQKKINDFTNVIREQCTFILTTIIPVMVIMIVMSQDIIRILFFRGNFSMNDVLITSKILQCFSLGLIFYVLRDVCNYAFFSMGDSKTPSKISIIVVIINIINNYIFSSFIGIRGIALATSLSGFIAFILLFKNLKKEFKNIKIIDIHSCFTILFGVILMIFTINILNIMLTNTFISIVIKVCGSLFTYFIIYLLFNLKKIRKIRGSI